MTVVDPRSLRWGDLVWSHFSRPRHGAFVERLDAAAAAGYSGVGLYLGELRRIQIEEGIDSAGLTRLLDGRELCLVDLEAVSGWWADPGTAERAEADADVALAISLAQEVGVRNVQIIGPYECDRSQAIDRLGALAERLTAHGLVASLEWLPFTNIDTLAEGRAIVTECGVDGLGLCVDIWHLRRGGNDETGLAALPAELVQSIQLNDGPMTAELADYKVDCLSNRLVPGAGEFDVAGFLATLRAGGVDVPLDLEVPSTELWATTAHEAARLAADATRTVLAQIQEKT